MTQRLIVLFISFGFAACASAPAPDAIAPCPTEARDAYDLDSDVPAGDPANGAVLFARECARCHSRLVAERGSSLFRDYPRLDCLDFQEKVSDAYLHRVVSEGGPSVGLDKLMKPFAETLSSSEIADLVAYLRALPPS